jgi:hypothetical protein
MSCEFDPNKSLDGHLAEFRKHLEELDAEGEKLFFDNQTTLLGDGNPARISIEGLRGINDDGDPLVIKFKPNTVNSIHAHTGR